MSEPSATPAPGGAASPYRRYLWAGIALIVLLVVWGIWSRLSARNALEREARAAVPPGAALAGGAHGD